jgi:hypothetical protein
MNHNHVHAVAEIVKKAATTIGAAGGVNAVAKGVSAWQAFREYNWLKAALVTNAVGDLRGMVLSKQWRAAFQFTVKTGSWARLRVLRWASPSRIPRSTTLSIQKTRGTSRAQDCRHRSPQWRSIS